MRRGVANAQPASTGAETIERSRAMRRAELAAAYQEAANDPVFMAEMRELDPYTRPSEDAGADTLTE